MNIFFGKISQKFDTVQLIEGYYSAQRGSSWFGDLEIGDYVYMIGGDKIQFWQVREWGVKNGKDCMYFDILNADLGINVSQLIALKFLKITKGLAVMSSRSARNKAFFKLELIKDITLADLSNSQYYDNSELYRTIKIGSREDINDNSEDIQLIYENNKLELFDNDFIENSIKKEFVDNLDKKGKGAKMKDTVLEFFSKAVNNLPVTISYKQIALRRFYDTFFCEYKNNEKYFVVGAFWDSSNPQDQTERFVKESIWFNGYTDKFNDEVNAVPVGSNIAIKAAFVREKTKPVMAIKARGIVIKNLNDGQTLEVEWEEDFSPFEVNFGGYMQTIKEVSKKAHIEAIWSDNEQTIPEETVTKKTNSYKTMNSPLNQILYGPPGTGKTYNTVLEAAKIVTGNENISYGDALKVFNNNLNNQIEFITFHQNYSYEDFIQGIRPDTENGKELSFEKKDGVFKRIADRAYKNLEASKNPATAKKEFDIVFQELIEPLNNLDIVELEIKMKKSSFYLTEIGEKSIEFRKNIGESQHTLSINTLRKMYEKGVNDIILGGLQPYYNPILALLLEMGKDQLAAIERKNYVIIIDEINRANISRVFGELITLIEEDKRSDGKIPLRVTLPSGDSFIVPSNLYIIGTMNTADKSIALLDIALRRRFEFVPKYPDSTVDGVYEAETLLLLNKAIQSRKGYDFTIGHAYFMGDDYTLENTVNKKVIPLLLEYFMNNEEEVIKIFKEANIKIGEWPLKMIV
nr:AAA family ATPase [uncultured Flavobacterium sp.]